MRIIVGTFAFSLVSPLIKMVVSAAESAGDHDVTFSIALHSDKPEVVAAVRTLSQLYDVRLFNYGYNRGLARSLNDMWLVAQTDDVYINCNDDIEWGPNGLALLAEKAVERRDCWMVSAQGWHSNSSALDSMGWCAAALNPIAMEQLGMLDENFYPAYYEDVDYSRRAKLAGLPEAIAEGTACHHFGSQTIITDHAVRVSNTVYYSFNESYFRRKWGDGYTTPFGAGGSLRIDPSVRRNPYGPHDRDDLPKEPLESISLPLSSR